MSARRSGIGFQPECLIILGASVLTARRRRAGRDFTPRAEAMDREGDHEERIRALEVPDPSAEVATLHIKVVADDDTVAAGDGKFIFAIAEDMDGLELTRVEAFVTTVSSSGIVQVQIRNITQAADMLTTRVQVDAGEKNSKTASTAVVISASDDDVAWADEIAIDVDAAGTGAKGLGIILEFS